MFWEEKTISSKSIFNGKILNLRVDTVELPNDKSATREIVEHAGAVAIVPITKDNKIAMVKQFRKPVEEFLLEIPAGKLEKGESPKLCALRELKEETGFETESIHHLITIYTSPGFSNEVIHIFVATDLIEGDASPDEDEYVSTEFYSLPILQTMIMNGTIKDGKTVAGILAVNSYLASNNIMDNY